MKKMIQPRDGKKTYTIREMSRLLERSGITLTAEQLQLLWSYHNLLRRYNPELNLTRIHSFSNMVLKLYADSILPGKMAILPSPLLDLGTGPGMPGIPLKIAFPELEIILAESRQNRVRFLEKATSDLSLTGISIVGRAVTSRFERPVRGVITRAVEKIEKTLERIGGCLASKGLAIFMKGPNCEDEIKAAAERHAERFRLIRDERYKIPFTPHERRLVVFERIDSPSWQIMEQDMEERPVREIESEQNHVFKDLKKLSAAREIKKRKEAILSGPKQVKDFIGSFPDRCRAWISTADQPPAQALLPQHVAWYRLAPQLFRSLDRFGTKSPLLLVKTSPIPEWDPAHGFPDGCSLLVPFQDPENVGAAVRSAVAFGAAGIILLKECASPFHPKAIRASGGTVFQALMYEGPSIRDLPDTLPVIALSSKGEDIAGFQFPQAFGILPGIEGPGLPAGLGFKAFSIPIDEKVESLNAATAAAVALYVWSRAT